MNTFVVSFLPTLCHLKTVEIENYIAGKSINQYLLDKLLKPYHCVNTRDIYLRFYTNNCQTTSYLEPIKHLHNVPLGASALVSGPPLAPGRAVELETIFREDWSWLKAFTFKILLRHSAKHIYKQYKHWLYYRFLKPPSLWAFKLAMSVLYLLTMD